jgi:hypothetical protein
VSNISFADQGQDEEMGWKAAASLATAMVLAVSAASDQDRAG